MMMSVLIMEGITFTLVNNMDVFSSLDLIDHVEIKKCRTLTKPVKLGKCLESIKANAFATSKYPVIITLEDHLTPKLQSKVAKVEFHSSLPI